MLATAIDWTDRVNDVPGAELTAAGDDRLSGGQPSHLAHDLPALGENGWSSGVMNRTIDSAPAQKRGIGGIHDRVRSFLCDVRGAVNFDRLAALEHESKCHAFHARGKEDSSGSSAMSEGSIKRPTAELRRRPRFFISYL